MHEEDVMPSAQIDRAVDALLAESLMWPVIVVFVVVVVAFVTPALVTAVRDGAIVAMVALALLAGLSVAVVHGEWRRRGRIHFLSLIVAVSWVLSVAGAYLSARLHLL